MTELEIDSFHYRIPGRTFGSRPGSHLSRSLGSGMNFASHARLMDYPDPRRLDLRASLGNVQKEWLVRLNQQRSSTSIYAIVDVSIGMHFGTKHKKLDTAANFLSSLGTSTREMGDAVGLLAFDNNAREDLSIAASYGAGAGEMMAEAILQSEPSSKKRSSISALSQCIQQIPSRSALVFLLSDYHWPLDELKKSLSPLTNTTLVPLVIWHRAETTPPKDNRLLSLQNMARTKTRHLWLNDKTRQQWADNVEQRKSQLKSLLNSIDSPPFFVDDLFNPEALSRFFMESRA